MKSKIREKEGHEQSVDQILNAEEDRTICVCRVYLLFSIHDCLHEIYDTGLHFFKWLIRLKSMNHQAFLRFLLCQNFLTNQPLFDERSLVAL